MAGKEAASSALKVVVFLGTVRENNYGSRAAKFMVKKLSEKGHDVTLLDPDVLNFPLLKKPLHFYKDQSEAPQLLQDTGKIIEAADAYVVVTAEYNNCLPPALTNLLDHFSPSSYQYRPSGIVCYSAGSYAGVRASTQARTLLGELGTPSIGSLLTIPKIQNTLTEDGTTTEERIDRSAERMIKELAWYATAIKTHKETHGYPK